MGFGDWLKGKNKGGKANARSIRRPDEQITAYDERGREVRIRRADWVSGILAPGIEEAWSNPDALYQHMAQAVRDDFIEQIVEAADHLVEIDHESDRALNMAGLVKRELGDLDGAERAFRRSIERNGPSGHVLANLARIFDRRGDKEKALSILREALDVDPNNDDNVLWWAVVGCACAGEGRRGGLRRRSRGALRASRFMATSALARSREADRRRPSSRLGAV